MNLSFKKAGGQLRGAGAWCLLALLALRGGAAPGAGGAEPLPKIEVSIDGQPLPGPAAGAVSVSPMARAISFTLGTGNSPDSARPLRSRYKFDGIDDRWQEGKGAMSLAVRFFDASGDQLDQVAFEAIGESSGWLGNLDRSTLTHRRETLSAPPKAASFWIVVSSAGPPATVGIFMAEGIAVSRLLGDGRPEVLLHPPLIADGSGATAAAPPGWMTDGLRPHMAKIAHFGGHPQSEGLEIIDDDPGGHAEWHMTREAAPRVSPGDRLLVEWNEVYSVGLAQQVEVSYPAPPPGNWRFHVQSLDILGNPVGLESVCVVTVRPPFWQRPWFWGAVAVSGCMLLLALNRYAVQRKLREELLVLRQERMLERERLRIARDIHDDLGARATHISLLSAMAEEHASSAEKARCSFEQISGLTRDLVFALYQIVWAVNPENDHLEALANHLCQIANKLCEPAKLRCRLRVSELPHPWPAASDVRHHLSMMVSEAIHNAIKHAQANEVTLSLAIEDSLLIISVRDDGRGFDPAAVPAGNGLANMRRRIEEIGGTVTVESSAGQGTVVRLALRMETRGSGIVSVGR